MSRALSPYKQRKIDRRAELPIAARPVPPWWVSRWACEGDPRVPNPYLHGSYANVSSVRHD